MSATRDDGGLRLTLAVPAGPYFRGELLPVTVTLANRSGAPVGYENMEPIVGSCAASAVAVTMTRGGQYVAPLSLGFAPSCPPPRPPTQTLPPGRAVRATVLLGLPVGGRLTLTAQASFPPSARELSPGLLAPRGALDGLRRFVPGLFRSRHAPFAAGWPALTLGVASGVPATRLLRLTRHGHTVHVAAPRAVVATLLAESVSACRVEGGIETRARAAWAPLGGADLADDGCDGADEGWQVLVGAPGYAVVGATYCFGRHARIHGSMAYTGGMGGC